MWNECSNVCVLHINVPYVFKLSSLSPLRKTSHHLRKDRGESIIKHLLSVWNERGLVGAFLVVGPLGLEDTSAFAAIAHARSEDTAVEII